MNDEHPTDYRPGRAPATEMPEQRSRKPCSTATATPPRSASGFDDSEFNVDFTVSARTTRGRILITITRDAIGKLARTGVDLTPLSVLARHMTAFRAVALEIASNNNVNHVVIEAKDVFWTEDQAVSSPDVLLTRITSGRSSN